MARDLGIVGVLLALAGAPAAAGPVVAVLDPDKNPRVALLEAELLADPYLTHVDRAVIEQTLKEQQLQASFGPQGVGERVRLGAVLKADVLILVRVARGAKEPTLDVVVSETAGGLRLLARPVPTTANPAADVGGLAEIVRTGLRTYSGKNRDVIAIPPFVSHDLTPEQDHLKAAFAKLAEQAATGKPGVVAVELAEAEAIAAELNVADPGAAVRRPPPLYLMGEYRHDGLGADRRVKLTLRTVRGGKTIGDSVEKTVPPAEAPAIIRAWAAALPGRGGEAARPTDSAAEARQLRELAALHRRLANWPEAIALAEAGVLSAPTDVALRSEAMSAIKAHMEHNITNVRYRFNSLTPPSAYLVLARAEVPLHRRWLAHLDVYITRGGLLCIPKSCSDHYYSVSGSASFGVLPEHHEKAVYYAEYLRITADVRREQGALFRRLAPIAARRPEWDVRAFLHALQCLPIDERTAVLHDLLLSNQDRKDLPELVQVATIWARASAAPKETREACVAFLDKLETEGNDGIKDGVRKARQLIADREKAIATVQARLAKEAEQKSAAAAQTKSADPPPLTFAQFAASLGGWPVRTTQLFPDVEPTFGFFGILPAGP
ncbi:MAG: hypothetical protein ACRC7O_02325, partial [Fimbriiglobus sp.]